METDTSHIYLNTLCKEDSSGAAVDGILARYGHSVLDEYTQQGKRWKTARIEDCSVALRVPKTQIPIVGTGCENRTERVVQGPYQPAREKDSEDESQKKDRIT